MPIGGCSAPGMGPSRCAAGSGGALSKLCQGAFLIRRGQEGGSRKPEPKSFKMVSVLYLQVSSGDDNFATILSPKVTPNFFSGQWRRSGGPEKKPEYTPDTIASLLQIVLVATSAEKVCRLVLPAVRIGLAVATKGVRLALLPHPGLQCPMCREFSTLCLRFLRSARDLVPSPV